MSIFGRPQCQPHSPFRNNLRRCGAASLALVCSFALFLVGGQSAAAQQPAAPTTPAADAAARAALGGFSPDLLSMRNGNSYSNCPQNTTSHTADCNFTSVEFTAPSGANGRIAQIGEHRSMTVAGPGLSLGNSGGWRVPKMYADEFTVATRGIAQAFNLTMSKHATGDTMGHYDYIFSDGGSTAESDESVKGYAIDMGETGMYFHGTVAATTGVGDPKPSLSHVSGNNWTTDGAPLLDISKGTISGAITGPSGKTPGSYLYSFPVDNALPLSTAFGVCDAPIPNNNQVETSTPFRCTVRLVSGAFRAHGQVCVAGPRYPEQAPIIAAGPVENGTQAITIAVRNPNPGGANIFQGGICGQYISFDANLRVSGFRSSYYAFGALDPHHVIYGFNLRGQLSNILPMGSGSEAEQFGVAGSNGYHLYPGCEVIDNQTVGANPVCEPNSVPWAAGDAVEAPHNVAVNMVGSFLDLVQNTPSNGGLSGGTSLTFHGMGTVGGNFIAHSTRNGNPFKLFSAYGGPFLAPDLEHIGGYFNNGFVFYNAPGAVIRVYGNADGSKSVMTLFAMLGGEVKWDPAGGTLLVPSIRTNSLALPNGKVTATLRGTTGRIGGAPLAVGSCATGTAQIAGATPAMVPTTVAAVKGAPGFSARGAFQVNAQVTAADTVTVNVCAILAGTPVTSSYIIVLQ